jgi:hypothetical protein
MRHMKVADNPTLSDESINRGLVCVARIPSCTDSKDPDAHVLDGWVPATKTHVGLASTHLPCRGNSTKRHRLLPSATGCMVWSHHSETAVTRDGQNIGQAPWTYSCVDMCAIQI